MGRDTVTTALRVRIELDDSNQAGPKVSCGMYFAARRRLKLIVVTSLEVVRVLTS